MEMRFGIQFKKVHGKKWSPDAVGAEQSKSTKLCSKNFVLKTCRMPMKQVYFIVLHSTLSGSKEAMKHGVPFKHVRN
jgi:hypothetical protein